MLFDKVSFIGMGLIGGSMALDIKARKLAKHVCAYDNDPAACAFIKEKNMAGEVAHSIKDAVSDAQLVVLAAPLSAMPAIAKSMAPHLKQGALITDTGSSKRFVQHHVTPFIPPHAHFIPAHPVAGTEHSGPQASQCNLFQKRWCVLTPPAKSNTDALHSIKKFWEDLGMHVAIMDAERHDKILALTSHLPHLIAFSIVGTATELEQELHHQVTLYAAGGFRDFTRIAASDATMWRDIFLNNKDFVLAALNHFHKKLGNFTDALKNDDADSLHQLIAASRRVHRAVVKAEQE